MIDRIRYMTVRKTYYHRKFFYQNQLFKIILGHEYQQMQHITISEKKQQPAQTRDQMRMAGLPPRE